MLHFVGPLGHVTCRKEEAWRISRREVESEEVLQVASAAVLNDLLAAWDRLVAAKISQVEIVHGWRIEYVRRPSGIAGDGYAISPGGKRVRSRRALAGIDAFSSDGRDVRDVDACAHVVPPGPGPSESERTSALVPAKRPGYDLVRFDSTICGNPQCLRTDCVRNTHTGDCEFAPVSGRTRKR